MTISSTGSQVCELDYVKVLAEFRRADELDAEAAYYGHRVMQTWVPALHAGACHTATAQVGAVAMARWMGLQLAHLYLADGSGAPATSTWCPVGAASPVPTCIGRWWTAGSLARGARGEYPAQPVPAAPSAEAEVSQAVKTAPRTTVPKTGPLATTDVVDRRRIALLSSQGPAEQIDLPQPDRKDHQYDHG